MPDDAAWVEAVTVQAHVGEWEITTYDPRQGLCRHSAEYAYVVRSSDSPSSPLEAVEGELPLETEPPRATTFCCHRPGCLAAAETWVRAIGGREPVTERL